MGNNKNQRGKKIDHSLGASSLCSLWHPSSPLKLCSMLHQLRNLLHTPQTTLVSQPFHCKYFHIPRKGTFHNSQQDIAYKPPLRHMLIIWILTHHCPDIAHFLVTFATMHQIPLTISSNPLYNQYHNHY
jgi:hypothetical protein